MSTRTSFALGVLILAFAVPACGGSSDAPSPTGEDGGQDADGNHDAAPSPIADSGLDSAPDAASACAETLAAWTAMNVDRYPPTFAAAQAACHGPPSQPSGEVTTAPCGGYDVYSILGLGEYFYYDPSTGKLVAVLTGVIDLNPMCAGPSTFVVPTGCTHQDFCTVYDAGQDAAEPTDSGDD